MWILGKTGTTAMDITALDIEFQDTKTIKEDTGEEINKRIYILYGYSFLAKLNLAFYEDEIIIRKVFNVILSDLKKGEDFLDIKNIEKKLKI